MLFSQSILIEQIYDETHYVILNEGLNDLTSFIREYVTNMKSISVKVKSKTKNIFRDMARSETLKFDQTCEKTDKKCKKFFKQLINSLEIPESDEKYIKKYAIMSAINLIINSSKNFDYSEKNVEKMSKSLKAVAEADGTMKIITQAVNVVKVIPAVSKGQ